MIRIKPTRRFRVSNRMALIGAITLTLTLFTGVDGMQKNADGMNQQAVVAAQSTGSPEGGDSPEHSKRFSISRLLFGHG